MLECSCLAFLVFGRYLIYAQFIYCLNFAFEYFYKFFIINLYENSKAIRKTF